MTLLLPLGLAIVFNAMISAGALLWSERQMKRVAAERAAENHGLFALERLSATGDEVQIVECRRLAGCRKSPATYHQKRSKRPSLDNMLWDLVGFRN